MTAPNRIKTSKKLIELKEIYLAEYGRHNLFCPQENEDFYLKYLSEDHVKELLAEKDKEIDRLKSQIPQWISVNERLPNKGERVLILTDYGGYDVCYLSNNGHFTNSMRPEHTNGGVTHWMPLPKQP